MNGASIFMLIVLAAALLVGMGFMVGELNRNADEILADRQTIQDLQAELDQAHGAAAQQQQAIDQLNATLSQQAAAARTGPPGPAHRPKRCRRAAAGPAG